MRITDLGGKAKSFFGIFLDGWTFIDPPSNNLRGGFEGSVIFTYSIL